MGFTYDNRELNEMRISTKAIQVIFFLTKKYAKIISKTISWAQITTFMKKIKASEVLVIIALRLH